MKRKLTSFLLILLLAVPLFTFYGCGEKTFEYESMLKIDAQFKGVRTMTLNSGSAFTSSSDTRAKFNEIIGEYCPSVLQREEVEEDGNLKYIFTLTFDSRSDYLSKLAAITNKQVQASLVHPNSELAKGWHYIEDIKTDDLFSWLKNGIEEKKYNDLQFDLSCTSNVINMGGDIQSCKSENTEINAVKGYPVTAIYIETTNNKKDNYDRKFTLSVPQKTYEEMGEKLISIMKKRTLQDAAYSGWTQQGNNQEYQIVYNGLSLSELQNATATFLDCDTVSLYYGDQNNSSTPLAEQLVFEENINTLSFVPKEDSKVELSYKYSLPLKTTHGEGVLLKDGVWAKTGEWIDGIYSLKSSDTVYDIRIPDGIQYEIKGINVTLESYDNDNFTRYFDFVYSSVNGQEGRDYAYDFLNKKGVSVTRIKSDDGVICRLSSKGSAKVISEEINKLFGGGNSLSYSQSTGDMSVVTNVSLTDEINISYMLTGKNKDVPLVYKLYTKGNESVSGFSGLTADGSGDISSLDIDKENGYVLNLKGGETTVKYTATLPYPQGVVIYCVCAGFMIMLTALLIFMFNKRSKTLEKKHAEMLARQAEKEGEKKKEKENSEPHNSLPEEHYDDRFNF
ncbi:MULTISPECIES: outer membrane protein assembly factor [unclassified Ruminococcus]|uniref:outer membrane protein assembly factor n=1 Tax=unclassified Ruminococcus TaxID=2608920 RepID=UPI00210DCF21|nr:MULTISPECIES: outer membrane protein assembly factor [unclassified Ruminococcus]MCQ4022686.1 hypothetical protein [Ruminococcus sp. zg-924]MCQ4114926.1 hypothetical protein [Ruminococcus sp. zg-921]